MPFSASVILYIKHINYEFVIPLGKRSVASMNAIHVMYIMCISTLHIYHMALII